MCILIIPWSAKRWDFFFFFLNEIWRFSTVSEPLMTSGVYISEPPCDEYSNAFNSQPLHMEHPWQKNKIIKKKKDQWLQTNVLSEQKAQNNLVPEGWQREALAPRTNCTAEEWLCANRPKKRQTAGFCSMLATDALTCFAGFLKGYHSFSVLFAPPPPSP